MHPLHDYVAQQLSDHLERRRVVVWYDPRSEFRAFVAELKAASTGAEPGAVTDIAVGSLQAKLVEYGGSMFAVRAVIEPLVAGTEPGLLVIYMAGAERDRKGSLLMEVERGGVCYEPALKRLARNVLRQSLTDGIIDERLAPESVGWDQIARLAAQSPDGGDRSPLRAIFPSANGNDGLLAAWLSTDAHDAEIEESGASGELAKLAQARLGLALADGTPLAKMRASVIRFVLIGEFRADLRCEPPPVLDIVPKASTKDYLAFIRQVADRFRAAHADAYEKVADLVESELDLKAARIDPAALGSIDTFRFEERALLRYCGDLIAAGKHDQALALVKAREKSFWVDRDVEGRKSQWEACRLVAELGALVASTRTALATMGDRAGQDAAAWVTAYSAERTGWFRLDQAYRRLEAWITKIDEEPESERALAQVRAGYEDVCGRMAEGFTRALEKAGWTVAGALLQTHVFPEVVQERPRPVAYFMVDAMRFEMGAELCERLRQAPELAVRPAVAALPTITPVGMAALLPGASASYTVVAQGGKLGSRIDGTFLPDLGARKKHFAARAPGLVDLALDDLLDSSASQLAKKVQGAVQRAGLVVVRSQEIDSAGEGGFKFLARQMMDNIIDNVARAVRKLAAAGIEYFVISADHGHLFSREKDDSMKIDAPGGEQVDLHRRCWIGRGGTTPAGCVRVTGAALGYDTDLDFVFPVGVGVFKAGGGLAFHHGGTSLQELLVPVVTVRMKAPESAGSAPSSVTVSGVPGAITNRIFSVTVQLGSNLNLFGGSLTVRPILMAAGKQVGAAGMAIDADFDRAAGTVKLVPGKPATVALMLAGDTGTATMVRVVILDPATDAALSQSPDIPVQLGM
jgi:hypothetical protein